ncbi:MAG: TetR/AcrR family transcriptional regulator [Methanobrevibacter sp. CfCl-M3]
MSVIQRRREREKKQRKQDIINAAEKLFFLEGFDNVSMSDIALEVELSKSTLYLYFENKESLFFAIVLKGTQILHSMIKNAVNNKNNGIDKVNAYRNAYNEFTCEYPNYVQIYNYFQSGRFNLSDKRIIGQNNDNEKLKRNENNFPYLSACATEILKLRKERFLILRDSLEMGIKDKTIRQDIDPAEVSILLSMISKNISNMSLDREKILKDLGINQKKYFEDVSKLIQYMISNKELKK